jgi:uncharacterized protein
MFARSEAVVTGSNQPQGGSEASKPRLVAPVWHTALFVFFVLGISFLGALQSHLVGSSPNQRPSTFAVYTSALIFQTMSLLYVWFGIRRKRVRIMDLIGGRWNSPAQVGRDIAIAAGIWVVWVGLELSLRILLHAPNPQSVQQLFPHTIAEKLGWLVVSGTAGFCEELTFRGYLQRQFFAITGRMAPAILLQAALFGFGHGYQGGKLIVAIFMYGVMFGWLAWWRRDLRSCMLAHAWTDATNIFVWGQSL